MFQRVAGTVGVGAIVTFAGLTAMVSTPAGVAAANAGACTVSGSASISPGLGAVPAAQGYNFSGATGTCVNNLGGAFAGNGTCSAGGLVTCASTSPVEATFIVSASSFGTCGVAGSPPAGTLVQEGGVVEATCQTTQGELVAVAVFVPNPAVQNPVTQVTFTGVAVGATAP